MAGTAGSKYGIINDGLPTTARDSVTQKLEPLIKNCPLCKKEAVVESIKKYLFFGKRQFYCECENINCKLSDSSDFFDTEEDAIDDWNRIA